MESKRKLKAEFEQRWPEIQEALKTKLHPANYWLIHRRFSNEITLCELAKRYEQNELSIEMRLNWIITRIRSRIDKDFGNFLKQYHTVMQKLEMINSKR